MSEPTPQDNKSKPAYEMGTLGALEAMMREKKEQQQSSEAFDKLYVPHNDPENNRRGEVRESQPGVKVAKYERDGKSLTYLINPGAEGRSGHNYDPDSSTFVDFREKFESLDINDLGNTTVIVEGRAAEAAYPTYEESIQKQTESGALAFLARQAGVERVISGEPDTKELRDRVAGKGFDRKDIALLDVLRSLPTGAANKHDFDLGLHMYTIIAERNSIEGFTELSDAQKEQIQAGGEQAVAQVQAKMRQQSATLVEGFNIKAGQELFVVNPDGRIQLNIDVDMADQSALDAALQPLHSQNSGGPLADVATEMSAQRDAILNDKIQAENNAGRDVVMTFGGSHFDALQGVFEAEFDSFEYPGWQPAETNPSNQEGENMPTDKEKREKIFNENYANYQSKYYKETNQARVDKANTPGAEKIKVDSYGDGEVTMIAQINTQKHATESGIIVEGEVIDGHDYNPEAQTFAEIEAQWQHYLATTPPGERLVIYEGPPMDERFYGSRESAIADSRRGDSGHVQWLARENSVETQGAEVGNIEQLAKFEKDGVSRDEAMLFFTLRSLAAEYNNKPVPEDLAMNFHFVLAQLETPGFTIFTEEQKQYLLENPDELVAEKQKVLPYVEKLNEILRVDGKPELLVTGDGKIGFADAVTNADVLDWIEAGNTGRLAEISRINIQGRDEGIFETIAEATQAGKKPFIVFGGSHVVSLEPVLKEYYGSQQVLE